MAALVILMVVIALVAGGVFANMYLYAHGAFMRREQFSEPIAVRESAEQRYYAHVGAQDVSTEQYARRVIGAFLIGAVLFITILILFWQSTLH
jgi:hypothetical protein